MYLLYFQHYYLVTDRVPEIRRAMGSTHFSTAFPKQKISGIPIRHPLLSHIIFLMLCH